MYLQDVDNVYHIKWNDSVLYGDIYLEPEGNTRSTTSRRRSRHARRLFDGSEAEGEKLLKGRELSTPPTISA